MAIGSRRRDRPDPVELLEEQAQDPRARARADPLRADARLAVHLLPRRRGDHGRGPRGHAAVRAAGPGCAATPTCRTSASSPPPSGAWSSTSTTSTRPCRARGSGTSSASPRASRSPGATAASRPKETREPRPHRGPRLPRGDARVRGDAQPRRLVRAPRRREPLGELASVGRQEADEGGADRTSPRPSKKNSMQAFDQLTRVVDGELRIISDPPLLVPLEELLADGPARRSRGADRASCSAATARRLKGDRRHLFDSYRFVHMARKVVGVGSVGTRAWVALLIGRDEQRPALPPGQGGRSLGARAVPRRERVRKPRRARRRGPAADAGRERHPARLASGARASTAKSATSTSASSGTGRDRSTSRPCRRRGWRSTGGSAAGPWPEPTHGPATGSRSAPTWAGRQLRPGDRRLLGALRGPERARLRRAR